MSLLTNDPARVAALSGFDSWRHSLPPKLGIDQFPAVLPMLYAGDDRQLVIAKEIDRTNLEALERPSVAFVFHSPYFSFDRADKPTDARPSLAAAVAEVANASTRLDDALPVSLYGQLADQLGCGRAQTGRFQAPTYHYVVPRATVRAQVADCRAQALAAAAPYFDRLESPGAALAWTRRATGDPLALLDDMMAEQGVEAVVASSPLNVQELSGVPAAQVGPGTWAVYQRAARVVHVLARREVAWLGLPEAPLAHAGTLREIADGACVGYEELDLTQAAFDAFALADAPTAQASLLLRRWRERRCWEDLPYYVMAAQVTRAAIEEAVSLVEEGMAGGEFAAESDAYERYRAVVAEQVRTLPIRVRTYFTHTHAGDRTHIPASATGHRIGRDTSLKIDAGLEVYDPRGYLRAVSDVTRSAVGTDDARRFRALLDDALTAGAIASCRPGTTGEEVFRAGLDHLEPSRPWLTDAGFCPASDAPLTEMFGRDIGHLLGKQEPATTVFQPGYGTTLEAGMIAAAEIQWPYRRYCVGVEDNFLITEDEPVNFTRVAR